MMSKTNRSNLNSNQAAPKLHVVTQEYRDLSYHSGQEEVESPRPTQRLRFKLIEEQSCEGTPVRNSLKQALTKKKQVMNDIMGRPDLQTPEALSEYIDDNSSLKSINSEDQHPLNANLIIKTARELDIQKSSLLSPFTIAQNNFMHGQAFNQKVYATGRATSGNLPPKKKQISTRLETTKLGIKDAEYKLSKLIDFENFHTMLQPD